MTVNAAARNQDPQLQFDVEQFYYQEATLLDERRYQTWLGLITDDLIYTMPSRHTAQADVKLKGSEEFLALSHELGRPNQAELSSPLREENALVMAFRAERAYKANAWGSNPPARTRRNIHNVQISRTDNDNELAVSSHFLMYYSRHQNDQCLYSGQRNDILRRDETLAFKIARREVILDFNVIEAPTLGLFF